MNAYDIVMHKGKEAIITDRSFSGYMITFRSGGSIAWISEKELTFVSIGTENILKQWELECQRLDDLDYIFAHGPEYAFI